MKLLERFGVVLSILCSIITIGFVVWRSGALVQMVETINRDVERIQQNGSGALIRHVALDDERVKGILERIDRQDKVLEALSGIQQDVREIKTEIRLIEKVKQ